MLVNRKFVGGAALSCVLYGIRGTGAQSRRQVISRVESTYQLRWYTPPDSH